MSLMSTFPQTFLRTAALAGLGTVMSFALASETAGEAAEVYAVKFHADWCGSCKVIAPSFEGLQEKFDTLPVLYITLDHTREHNRQQAEYLAQGLGLDEVIKEKGGKTGFILLIDAETKEVLGTLNREHNLKVMGASLQEAVATAQKS